MVIIINNDNIYIGKNMTKVETDLILHPLRFRLLQSLLGKQLTTRQIAEDMPGIPVSSIYRHLKTLLDAGLVQVVETNRIKGTEEKIYTVGELPTVAEEDLSGNGGKDRQRYFAAYMSYLLKRFSDFIATDGLQKMEIERAGFTETLFYATPNELDELAVKLNSALQPLLLQEKTSQRQRQLFSVITFPIERKGK